MSYISIYYKIYYYLWANYTSFKENSMKTKPAFL